MKVPVTLVFPPQWEPKQPYLALPALAACLRAEGVPTTLVDANIEYYDTVLNADYLSETIYPRLEAAASRNGRHAAKQLERLPLLAERVGVARGTMRDPVRFFEFQQFREAKQVINDCLAAVSAAFHPTRLNFHTFSMRYPFVSSAAMLAAAEDEAENPFLEFFRGSLLPRLRKAGEGVVGISVSSVKQIVAALTLSRQIKRHLPGNFVVLGGNTFSRYPGQLRGNPRLYRWVDGFVVGEGETPLVELVRTLERGADLGGVPNLFWRGDWASSEGEAPERGAVRENARRPPEDMNTLPAPDFDGLPLDRYFSPSPVLPLETSRGCVWGRCAFCTHQMLGEVFRFRRPEKVLADIRRLSGRYGASHFMIVDNTAPTRVLREMSEGLIADGPNIHWSCYARYTTAFTDQFCRRLARAGCRSIWFGLESASQRVLDLMNKGTDIRLAREINRRCHEAGIAVDFFCMLGFPSETRNEALETLAFLLDGYEGFTDRNSIVSLDAFALDVESRVGKNPEAYGVTLIGDDRVPGGEAADDAGTGADLNPIRYFTQESGMSIDETAQLVAQFNGKLTRVLGHRPLEAADREAHLLLHRSHPSFVERMRARCSSRSRRSGDHAPPSFERQPHR